MFKRMSGRATRRVLLALVAILLCLSSSTSPASLAVASDGATTHPGLEAAKDQASPDDAHQLRLASQQTEPPEYLPDRLVVRWRSHIPMERINQINRAHNVVAVAHIPRLDTHILRLPPQAVERLLTVYNRLPEVVYAEPDYLIYGLAARSGDPIGLRAALRPDGRPSSDPLTSQQYSLGKMSVPAAWDQTTGDGVVVAVLDSGLDFNHPDLQGKSVSRGYDFINNDADATDDAGHGTIVAGVIAAATDNGIGIAGVGFNARLLPVKVLNSSGVGSYASVAQGIIWATDQGARVINLSLGWTYPSSGLESAINDAWSRGVVVVAAAGNGNTALPFYPASYTNVIGVGAIDQNDAKASFSNMGVNVKVVAPGVDVLTTVRGGSYQMFSGTSLAAPNAAGVAALVAAAHPSWSNAQIRAAIEDNADPLGNPDYFGRGRVNAQRAVGAGGAPAPSPTRTPTATPTATPTPTSIIPKATDLPPTRTSTPTPTSATVSVSLTPPPGVSGYVVSSSPNTNSLGSADMYAGSDRRSWRTTTWIGATQFNLAGLPDTAEILSAQLDLTGRTTVYVDRATAVQWEVQVLNSTLDAGWTTIGYTSLSQATPVAALTPLVGTSSLGQGVVNRFSFGPEALAQLTQRLGTTDRLSLRVVGSLPTPGYRAIADWATGISAPAGHAPLLQVIYRR